MKRTTNGSAVLWCGLGLFLLAGLASQLLWSPADSASRLDRLSNPPPATPAPAAALDLLVDAGEIATAAAPASGQPLRWRQVGINPSVFSGAQAWQRGTRLHFAPFPDREWDVVVEQAIRGRDGQVTASATLSGHPGSHLDLTVLAQRVVFHLDMPDLRRDLLVAAAEGRGCHIALEREVGEQGGGTDAAARSPQRLAPVAPVAPAAAVRASAPAAVPQGTVPVQAGIAIDAAGEQRFHGARIFGNGRPVIAERLPAGQFREALGRLTPDARQRALTAMAGMCIPEADFSELHVDSTGSLFYACRQLPLQDGPTSRAAAAPSVVLGGAQATLAAAVPITATPLVRHSRPGSSNVLYLDFHGPVISGTQWNAESGVASYACTPWSDDGDSTTFSEAELATIATIWERVAEDYAPFDLDVTTVEPAVWTSTTGHAVFTPTVDANGVALPHNGWGGYAYIDVFGLANYSYNAAASKSPAWVTAYSGMGALYMAETASHEFGHNVGLHHDGLVTPSTTYYYGHPILTGVSRYWGPIMGGGAINDISQWSKGEYNQANNPEDDLAIIAARLGYRPADRGASAAGATAVTMLSTYDFTADGVIERTNGSDWFSFAGTPGTVVLSAEPYRSANQSTWGGNLDLRVELYDANLQLIGSDDLAGDVSAPLTAAITYGTYYLRVGPPSATVGDPYASSPTGYTTYAVLGQYVLSGHLNASPVGEIAALGAGQLIANGDTTPTSADDTDFGTTQLGSPITHSFTVRNVGASTLAILSVAVVDPTSSFPSQDFSVSRAELPSTLAPGEEGSISVISLAANAGTPLGRVEISGPQGSFSFEVQATVLPNPPVITAIEPAVGTIVGNQSVWIYGQNLSACTFTFGGQAATVTYASDTGVIVVYPPHARGLVAVKATNSVGSVTVPDAFRYQDLPLVSGFAPAAGPVGGGTVVQMTGQDFTGVTVVMIDNVFFPCTVVDDSHLTFTTPSHLAGSISVTIANTVGETEVPAAFTYVDPPQITALTPDTGSEAGGQVTIAGGQLTGASVTFDGVAVPVVSASDSAVVVLAPAHAVGQVPVVLTAIGGTASTTFTYLPLPILTTIAPHEGPLAGGTVVTIDGFRLTAGTAAFDGVAATDAGGFAHSDTQLQAASPAHSAGAVALTVTTPVGSTTSASAFLYRAAPAITSVTPALLPLAGGASVTIGGTDLERAQVLLDGVVLAQVANTATSIVITAPAHAAGPVALQITTAGGTAILPAAMTYAVAPSISGIAPAYGPLEGGTTVTISGADLGGVAVTFDGQPATVVSGSATAVTVLAPAHTAGTVVVQAANGAGTATRFHGFTYLSSPIISGMSPVEGPLAGGTAFTITGSNLFLVTVGFDGVAAEITSATGTQVSGIVPPHALGQVAVQVSAASGSATVSGGFTYRGQPQIGDVTPPTLGLGGGAALVISGSDLAGAQVVIDGVQLNVLSASETSITAVAPAHAAGAVDVLVVTVGGSATASAALTFAPPPGVTSIAPSSGSVAGGYPVVIHGTDLQWSTVRFGSTPCSIVAASSTELTVTVPAHMSGAVGVVLQSGAGSTTVAGGFTYLVPPNVTYLTPTSGPLAGGTAFIITGSGLSGSTVAFDGVAATDIVASDTQITGITPAHASGTVAVAVTGPAGPATAPDFTYLHGPVVTSVTPTRSPLAGGVLITISGTGLGSATVRVDGVAVAPVSDSETTITVSTPAHAAGHVTLALSTPGGSVSTAIDYQDDGSAVTTGGGGGGGGGGCGLGGLGGGLAAVLSLVVLRLARRRA